MTDIIDVMILCGGSKSDLPSQGPEFAALFNTVDAYDTHQKFLNTMMLLIRLA